VGKDVEGMVAERSFVDEVLATCANVERLFCEVLEAVVGF
jgi:hypothetical protein